MCVCVAMFCYVTYVRMCARYVRMVSTCLMYVGYVSIYVCMSVCNVYVMYARALCYVCMYVCRLS